MAVLNTLNRVSIAQICVYSPSLVVAIVLATRHGFGKSSGWYYLVLFSVIRILGASMQLATVNDPDNISLIVGSMTLESAGLSPLILVNLGLIARVAASISKTTDAILQPRAMKLIQMLVLVGLILSIVGGVKLGDNIGEAQSTSPQPTAATGASSSSTTTNSVAIPSEMQAGIGLMIAGFVILVGAAGTLAIQMRAIERGERRLLLAVACAVPFVAVRIIYSAMATYTSNPDFRWYAGSSHYTDYLIGLDTVMEMAAVVVIEGIGLTVRRIPKGERGGQAVPTGKPVGEIQKHKDTDAITA